MPKGTSIVVLLIMMGIAWHMAVIALKTAVLTRGTTDIKQRAWRDSAETVALAALVTVVFFLVALG